MHTLHKRLFVCLVLTLGQFSPLLAVPPKAPAPPKADIAALPTPTLQPPASIRPLLPKKLTPLGGLAYGEFYLCWWKPQDEEEALPFLTVLQRRQGRWNALARYQLKDEDLPLYESDPAVQGSKKPAHRLENLYYLRPASKEGLIVVLRQKFSRTLYVFPKQLSDRPVIWSAGTGVATYNCDYIRVGGPDSNGFRVLFCRFVIGTTNPQGKTDNKVAAWTRYWSGDGWNKQSPERSFYTSEVKDPIGPFSTIDTASPVR